MAKFDVYLFGTTYLNDKPQSVPKNPMYGGDIPDYSGNSAITIGATVLGKTITWIRPHGLNLFVADRTLLAHISWEDLYKSSLVKGQWTVINGQCFLCRLLRVGESPERPNEWDDILNITGPKDSLWHWKNMPFLGADTAIARPEHRVTRGHHSARNWSFINASYRSSTVGFRPVLEPLGPNSEITPDCKLDGMDFCLSNIPGSEGFCPILVPVDGGVFRDVPKGQQVRMYTLLKDGRPVRMDTNRKSKYQDDLQLELTNRYYGNEFLIPWTVSNGIAVASRILLQHD